MNAEVAERVENFLYKTFSAVSAASAFLVVSIVLSGSLACGT